MAEPYPAEGDGHPIQSDTGQFAQVQRWLLKTDVSDRAIRLYAVLGLYADWETGVARPSRSTLAEWLHCSTDSIDRALRELTTAGALEITRRFDKDRRQWLPSLFTLKRVAPLPAPMPPGVAAPVRPGSRTTASQVAAPVRTEPEPLVPEPMNETDAQFAAFWNAYPRKTAKAAARKVWDRAVKAAAKQHPHYAAGSIIDGAIRYAEDPNRLDQFTAHATTWLNQERWNDPAEPSRTGLQPSRAREREQRTAQALNNVLGNNSNGNQPRQEIGR